MLHLAQGREARKNDASSDVGWEGPHEETVTRMDCVFFIPPRPFFDVGGRRRHRDFDLALDNVWYGRLALLFKMTVRTDSNELRDVECAMVDVLFDYAEGRC